MGPPGWVEGGGYHDCDRSAFRMTTCNRVRFWYRILEGISLPTLVGASMVTWLNDQSAVCVERIVLRGHTRTVMAG